jgi:hypothetical protein
MDERETGRTNGSETWRPLADDGWGPERAARRARRRRSYVTASRLQLDDRGRAETRLEFPRTGGKGVARADAACAVAAAYGVEARSVYRIHRTYDGAERVIREDLVLTVHGDAEAVARFVAGLPRVLDYAETITTQAVRSYGDWARRPAAEPHLEYLDDSGRRARVRQYRAAAFRTIVEVLVGQEDAVLPEVDVTLPPWDQVEAIAGGRAQYGWVPVAEAYDPAEVEQLLADAHQFGAVDAAHAAEAAALLRAQLRRSEALFAAFDAPAERWPVDDPHGEQLALFDETAEAETPTVAGPVVVIPCSARKMDHPAEAGELYVGSLHTMARRTADALTAAGGTVLILSALYGLLPLTQVIQPYDHRWSDPGSITTDELRAQAAQLGLAGAEDVILLTPGEYTKRAAAVWPHARTPLAHLGIGQQRGRLAALRPHPGQYATAA